MEPVRVFYCTHESYYHQPIFAARQNMTAEIVVCLRYDGGGFEEFVIRWYKLMSDESCCVEVFQDGFNLFVKLPDLFSALAELGGTHPTPAVVVRLLEKLGFKDKTERTKPSCAVSDVG
jgi:hypothetical protein